MPKLVFRKTQTVLVCLLMTTFLSSYDIPGPGLSVGKAKLCLRPLSSRNSRTPGRDRIVNRREM